MGRGKSLSQREQERIADLRIDGTSIKTISYLLDRSQDVIRKYLKDPAAYRTNKHKGRPPVIDQRTKRRIVRMAKHSGKSAYQIKHALKLQVSTRRVQQILSSNPHLE